MNNEIRTAWCARLRSGEVKQGTGALVKRDHKTGEILNCCLGVLTELAVEADILPEGTWLPGVGAELKGFQDDGLPGARDGQTGVLPMKVALWAGLGVQTNPVTSQGALATLNDGGKTFIEIADAIERDL